jgi:glucose-6-phosphate 1-dehydrogenase
MSPSRVLFLETYQARFHRIQVKVLRCIPPIETNDVLLGQYVAANGKPGYLDDETVPPNSTCPTFAATTLWIHNPRWEGVPFILKAGKGKSKVC